MPMSAHTTIHMSVHMSIHMCIHMYVQTHAHTQAHAHVHVYARTRVHILGAYSETCPCTCLTHVHRYVWGTCQTSDSPVVPYKHPSPCLCIRPCTHLCMCQHACLSVHEQTNFNRHVQHESPSGHACTHVRAACTHVSAHVHAHVLHARLNTSSYSGAYTCV